MQSISPDYETLKQADLPLNAFINLGLQIIRKKWRILLALYCVLLLPCNVAEYICSVYEVSGALVLVPSVIAQLVFICFTALIVESEVRTATMPHSVLLRYGCKRLLPALITLCLFAGVLILTTLALIIPGIIFGVFFQFGVVIAVTRNQAGMRALQYSMHLVRGRWWYAFACSVMFSFVIPIVLSMPFMMLLGGGDPTSAKSVLMNNTIGGLASIPGNVMLILVFLNFDYQPSQTSPTEANG